MKDLKIHIYEKYDDKPQQVISIPFSMLHITLQHLLPKKVKTLLKDGINLMQCKDLTKEKGIIGTLIEIENPFEKTVISVE